MPTVVVAEEPFQRVGRDLKQALCAAVILLALAVMLGWTINLGALTTVRDGLVPMKFNSALCFGLLGLGLWLIDREPSSTRQWMAAAAGLIVLAVIGLTVAEVTLGFPTGVDELIVRDALTSPAFGLPGRMSGASSLSFGMLAVSTILLSRRSPTATVVAQLLAFAALLVGVVVLLGYVLRVDALYDVGVFTPVAVLTGLLLVMTGSAALLARPDGPLIAPLTDTRMGGQMARRLIPRVLVALLAAASAVWLGELLSWFDARVGVALRVVSSSVCAAVGLWSAARILNGADTALRRANQRARTLARCNETVTRLAAFDSRAQLLAALCDAAVAEGSFHACRIDLEGPVSQTHGASPRAWPRAAPDGPVIVAPVVLDGRSVGTMTVDERQPHDADDATLLAEVAGIVGLALARFDDLQSHEALNRYKATLASIVEGSDDAIIGKTLDGLITSWNAGAARMFGYAADEIIGRSINRLMPEGRLDEEEQIVARIRAGERVNAFDTIRRTKSGDLLDVSIVVSPVFDAAGTVIGASNVTRDITRRRQAEQRGQLLFESAPNALMLVDADGRVVVANQQAGALFGYTRDELQGMRVDRLLPERFRLGVAVAAAGAASPASVTDPLMAPDLMVLRADGAEVPVEVGVTPLRSGRDTLSLASINDISERRRRDAELRRSNADLEQFAYAASHDLQEPLRAVSGCVLILKRRYQGQLDAQADELIEHVVDGAHRMQALIDGLLQFSRVTTKGQAPGPTSLDAAFAVALKNLATATAETSAVITRDELPTLTADLVQMTVVFQNLIGNALKFRGEQPPRIHVSAEDQGRQWVIAVQDNGIGIDPQQLEQVFEIFKRLQTRRQYPGAGIGLSLCKRIVERFGGRIWATSSKEGSVFRFSLPK